MPLVGLRHNPPGGEGGRREGGREGVREGERKGGKGGGGKGGRREREEGKAHSEAPNDLDRERDKRHSHLLSKEVGRFGQVSEYSLALSPPTKHLSVNISLQTPASVSSSLSLTAACVRLLAVRTHQHKMTLTRKKFKLAVSVYDTMADDLSRSRKTFSSATKRKVKEEDDHQRLTRLTCLEKQGQMLAVSADEEAEVWEKTIQTLPSEQIQFVLNAPVDTLHTSQCQPATLEEEGE